MFRLIPLLLAVSVLVLTACSSEVEERRFTLLSPAETGIDFENILLETPEFNILNYLYYYDGGGVAVGDINQDGLPDLFFTGNETGNRLYLNLGDFRFADITAEAGITDDPDAWSTGVTMADITGNGYPDIYISRVNYLSKSGPNQLFINNGDGTFSDRAADYGLDFIGYSTQALFFDYNNSGRLDLFLLNHSFHSEFTYGQAEALRQIRDPKAGDRLFRNDGHIFTDVTEEAGINSSALGYGLGVAVSDLNLDGWPDIYVGNDFHEDDYLYLNNGDGTFTETLYSVIGHTSGSSMGNDIADITNNGRPDIISLDMMPNDRSRYMRSGGPDLVPVYETKLEFGFGPKNASNTLQYHNGLDDAGNPYFSEVAWIAGIARTDWSWASLFMDLDNSGYNDLFITNGMVRRPNDLDFVRVRNASRQSASASGGLFQGETLSDEDMELLAYMPELKIPNVVYQNQGDLTFRDVSEEWGFSLPSVSNGAAWADLNNNGRLDLIVNNINMPASVYRNNTPDDGESNYLKIELRGEGMNRSGIGSNVTLFTERKQFYREQMPTRGFQSSVDHLLHAGLGGITMIDSMRIIWPDNRIEMFYDVKVNQTVVVSQSNAMEGFDYSETDDEPRTRRLDSVEGSELHNYTHRENQFNDFSREPLLPYKLSREGPALAVGDINGDGLDDLFIGGARWQAGSLYLQSENSKFTLVQQNLFYEDRESEDVDAIFFDATGNGLPDLYVVSGGGELTGISEALKDRLYINNGDGRFTKSTGRLPDIYMNGSVVRAADLNGNGFQDLFVGSRSVPYRYGLSPRSFLLVNDGSGHFLDKTEEIAPELREAGMVTDARWIQLPGKALPNLIVAAEWKPLLYLVNDGYLLRPGGDDAGVISTDSGLWQSLQVDDIDGNGYPDIIAGNIGLNTRLSASKESPLSLYLLDSRDTGQAAPLVTTRENGSDYPFEQLDELLPNFPELTNRVGSYRDYSEKSAVDLFGRERIIESEKFEVTELASLIYHNNGDGTFTKERLPTEAQFSPVRSILTLGGDLQGGKEILMGGNIFHLKPGYGGRQDASYGTFIRVDPESGMDVLEFKESGYLLKGEISSQAIVRLADERWIVVAVNGDRLRIFRTGSINPDEKF
ncbi:MAG: VCBS repeat-containing protein [Balneolaceae bacterium]